MALAKRTEKVYNQLECGTCKKRFWMTCAYLEHMSTQGHFSFSCNICNKVFSDQKQLDTHYITHKEVTNTYNCKQCPRKFLQKNQLEQHMQFHFTFLPEKSVRTKKAVHFSSILESQTISGESSYSDSDFSEDYKPPKKTRSGRVVKAKKMFEDKPVVKRQRKSSNKVLKKDSKNSEESLKLSTADDANITTEKLMPVSSSTSSKEVFNKKLVVLVDKLPESVYKSCVASGNICNLGSTSNQKLVNPYATSDGKVNIGTASKILVYEERTDEVKTNTPNKSNSVSYKNSNIVVSVSTVQSPVISTQEHRFLTEINSFLNIPYFPNKINTMSYYYTSPQVNKQFLYVGPNQDMNKIQNIIEKLKTKPTYDLQSSESMLMAKASSSRSSQSMPIENTPNVGNLSIDTQNKNLSEGTRYEHEFTKGILGKKVLDDVILIKVTPELMQKMQKATLSAAESHRNLESSDTATVLPVCPKDLNQVSQVTERSEMSELVQSETLQSEQENFESLNTAKSANISSVTYSVNKNLSQISHMAEKNETPELMQTVHSETSVFLQKGNENSISFSAYKSPNISPMSSSLKKNSSNVSQLAGKNGKPTLMQKVHKKTSVLKKRGRKKLKSFSTVKTVNISSSCSFNDDLSKVSQVVGINKTPNIIQNRQKKNLILPQKELGDLKSSSAVKTINTSSVSSSMNKKLSGAPRIIEKHDKLELMPKVCRKTLLSSQKECKNLKSFIVSEPANISESSCENSDLTEVSQLRDKSKPSKLMQNVQKKNLMFPQLGHGNSESFSAITTVKTSSMSYTMNKKLSQVSRITEKNKKPGLIQKADKKTLVPLQKGHKKLKLLIVQPADISQVTSITNKDLTKASQSTEKDRLMQKMSKPKVSLQRACGNIEPSSAVMPVSISSMSASLNKDLTESTEKNKLLPKVMNTTEVSLQKEHGNLEPSSVVLPVNISLSSCNLIETVTGFPAPTANKGLMQVTELPQQKTLGPSNLIVSANVSPVFSTLNKNLTEIPQPIEKNKLKQKVKRKAQRSHLRKRINLKPSSEVMPVNVPPVPSHSSKGLTEVSQLKESDIIIQNVRSEALVHPQKGQRNLEPSCTVLSSNISPVSSCLNKDLTQASQSTEKNRLMQKMSKPKVSLQRTCGNIEPSSAVMPVSISSMSASLNKDLTESTEKNKLLPKVMNTTEVSMQKEHGNLEPSSVVLPVNILLPSCNLIKTVTGFPVPTANKGLMQVTELPLQKALGPSNMIVSANVLPVFSTLNKNLTEVPQPIEKNILKQKVKRKAQRSHLRKRINLKPSSEVMPVNVPPVLSHSSKGLTEVSQLKESDIIIQNVRSEALVHPQKGQRDLEPSCTVLSSSISPVSSCLNKDLTQASESTEKNIIIQNVRSEAQVHPQKEQRNLEPSCTVMSANICPVSSSLNKNLTEASQSTEKNIIQNVKSEAKVFLQREQENLEISTAVMSSNISSVSSHLNQDLTEVSQSTEKGILMQRVKSETQVSQQIDPENLEPCTVVLSTNISPVSCSLNKDLTKVSQSTEKNKMSKLLQKIKRESPQKTHKNLESFQATQPVNISSVSSSLTGDSKIADKCLKSQTVNCETPDTLSIPQVTSNATLRKPAKIPEQNIESSLLIDKKCAGTASSQLEQQPSSSREEKLLARYKAKIEEKERKKKEKYELKKRMHYLEKIKSGINPNLTELMQVFKEAQGESSTLARNLEREAELPLQLKTKSVTTEIISGVKEKKSISKVNNKNVATLSVRSKKQPCKK